jgi:ketosteroid isomerase-like protein
VNEGERNAETLRLGFESYNRHGVEAIVDLIDPEFEAVVPPDVSVEPDTYRGEEGIRRYFAAFEGAMEDVQFHFDEAVPAGEHVLTHIRLQARGAGTGIEVEQSVWQLWTMRDDKAVRMVAFATREDAERAAGIRP